MEIIRKVFCGDSYEGLYKLVKSDEYEWIYVNGTTGEQVNPDEFDYPILNIEYGRGGKVRAGSSYLLNTRFLLEPQDLEDGNSLGG